MPMKQRVKSQKGKQIKVKNAKVKMLRLQKNVKKFK